MNKDGNPYLYDKESHKDDYCNSDKYELHEVKYLYSPKRERRIQLALWLALGLVIAAVVALILSTSK